MGVLEWIIGVVLMLFSVAIIIVVLLQEGHEKNVGVITGSADTFFDKNQSRTVDKFLERWTKFIAVGFFLLAMAINAIAFFN